MRWPLISIVTPSYNQARYIGTTVRSVLLQRYPSLEYVVMDGGSTDGTRGVLEPYRPWLADCVSERDGGQSDAIAKGFARCSGEILAYLNSDDVLAPGALACVARFFAEHPSVDAVYSHRVAIDSGNRVRWYWHLPRHSDYLMSRWDMIPQETCFWRRRIVERVGGIDPSLRFAMDYDLFARFMRDGRMVRLDRFLGAFRQHAESKTSTLLETVGSAEVRLVRERYGLAAKPWDRVIGDRFWRAVVARGERFARSGRSLPGCLPGVGYDYDRVWGGLLSDPAADLASLRPDRARPAPRGAEAAAADGGAIRAELGLAVQP